MAEIKKPMDDKKKKAIVYGTAGVLVTAGIVTGVVLGVKSCDDKSPSVNAQANKNQQVNERLQIKDGTVDGAEVLSFASSKTKLENVKYDETTQQITEANIKGGEITKGNLSTGNITGAEYASAQGWRVNVSGKLTDANIYRGNLKNAKMTKGHIISYSSKTQNTDGTWNFEDAEVEEADSTEVSIEHIKSFTGTITEQQADQNQPGQQNQNNQSNSNNPIVQKIELPTGGTPFTPVDKIKTLQQGIISDLEASDITFVGTFVGTINGQTISGVISEGQLSSGKISNGNLQTGTITEVNGTVTPNVSGIIYEGDITSSKLMSGNISSGIISGGVKTLIGTDANGLPIFSITNVHIEHATLTAATTSSTNANNPSVKDAMTSAQPQVPKEITKPVDSAKPDTLQPLLDSINNHTTLSDADKKAFNPQDLSGQLSFSQLGLPNPHYQDGQTGSLTGRGVNANGDLIVLVSVSEGTRILTKEITIPGFKTADEIKKEEEQKQVDKDAVSLGSSLPTSFTTVLASSKNYSGNTLSAQELGISLPVGVNATFSFIANDDDKGEVSLTAHVVSGSATKDIPFKVTSFLTNQQKADAEAAQKAQQQVDARKNLEDQLKAVLPLFRDQDTSLISTLTSSFVGKTEIIKTYDDQGNVLTTPITGDAAALLGIVLPNLSTGPAGTHITTMIIKEISATSVKVLVELQAPDGTNKPISASTEFVVSKFKNPDEALLESLQANFSNQVTSLTNKAASEFSVGSTSPIDLGITPFVTSNGATISYEVVSKDEASGKVSVRVIATKGTLSVNRTIEVSGFKTAAKVIEENILKQLHDYLSALPSTYTTTLNQSTDLFTVTNSTDASKLGITLPITNDINVTMVVKSKDANTGSVIATVTLTKGTQTLTQDITVNGFKTAAQVAKEAQDKAETDALALFKDQITSHPDVDLENNNDLKPNQTTTVDKLGITLPSNIPGTLLPSFVVKSVDAPAGKVVVTVTIGSKTTDFVVSGFLDATTKADAQAAADKKITADIAIALADKHTTKHGEEPWAYEIGKTYTASELGIDEPTNLNGATITFTVQRRSVIDGANNSGKHIGVLNILATITKGTQSTTKTFKIDEFAGDREITVWEYNGKTYTSQADALAVAKADQSKLITHTYQMDGHTYTTSGEATKAQQDAIAAAISAQQHWNSGTQPANGSVAPKIDSVTTVFVLDGKAFKTREDAINAYKLSHPDIQAQNGSYTVKYDGTTLATVTIDNSSTTGKVWADIQALIASETSKVQWVNTGHKDIAGSAEVLPTTVVTLPVSGNTGDIIKINGTSYEWYEANKSQSATEYHLSDLINAAKAAKDTDLTKQIGKISIDGVDHFYQDRNEIIPASKTLQGVRDDNPNMPFDIDGKTYTDIVNMQPGATFVITNDDGSVKEYSSSVNGLFDKLLNGKQAMSLFAPANLLTPESQYPMLISNDAAKKFLDGTIALENKIYGISSGDANARLDKFKTLYNQSYNINKNNNDNRATDDTLSPVKTALANLKGSTEWNDFWKNIIRPIYTNYFESRNMPQNLIDEFKNSDQVDSYKSISANVIKLFVDSGLMTESGSKVEASWLYMLKDISKLETPSAPSNYGSSPMYKFLNSLRANELIYKNLIIADAPIITYGNGLFDITFANRVTTSGATLVASGFKKTNNAYVVEPIFKTVGNSTGLSVSAMRAIALTTHDFSSNIFMGLSTEIDPNTNFEKQRGNWAITKPEFTDALHKSTALQFGASNYIELMTQLSEHEHIAVLFSASVEHNSIALYEGIQKLKDSGQETLMADTVNSGVRLSQDQISALPNTLYLISRGKYTVDPKKATGYFKAVHDWVSDANGSTTTTSPSDVVYYRDATDPNKFTTTIKTSSVGFKGSQAGWYQSGTTLTPTSTAFDLSTVTGNIYEAKDSTGTNGKPNSFTTDQKLAKEYVAAGPDRVEETWELQYTDINGTLHRGKIATNEHGKNESATAPSLPLITFDNFTKFIDKQVTAIHEPTTMSVTDDISSITSSGVDVSTLHESTSGFTGFIYDGKYYATEDDAKKEAIKKFILTNIWKFNSSSATDENDAQSQAAAAALALINHTPGFVIADESSYVKPQHNPSLVVKATDMYKI